MTIRRFLALGLLLASTAAAAAPPPVRGVAVSLWGNGDVGAELREIKGLGATHVELAVYWRQPDVRSTALAPTASTVSDDRLRATIRAARAAGLEVLLLPIIDVEKRAPGVWRGTLAPSDIDEWWQAYRTFIVHYALLAAEEKVAYFSVGSELASTEAWRDRWYSLISAVRRQYPGKLVYSANWDHYEGVTFWERLDAVGVTGYNELATADDASEADLAAAWAGVRTKLVAHAAKVGKPLLLTEIGYTSQDGAARHPWDYTVRSGVDLEEQRRCYAALVRAWGEEPALQGVFIWEWSGAGGTTDRGYTPRGKPAEIVLRSWFGMK